MYHGDTHKMQQEIRTTEIANALFGNKPFRSFSQMSVGKLIVLCSIYQILTKTLS